MRRCVWSRNIKNEEAMARVGSQRQKKKCHFLLYYGYVRLNIFRAPLFPSSEAHDDSVVYHIGRLVLELLLVEI